MGGESRLSKILEQIVPLYYLSSKIVAINKWIESAGPGYLKPQPGFDPIIDADGDALVERFSGLSEKELRKHIELQRLRAVQIDGKTYKLTLPLSFGLAALGSVSAILLPGVTAFESRVIMFVFLFVALIYFFYTAFVAIDSLRIEINYGTLPRIDQTDDEIMTDLPIYLVCQVKANAIRKWRNEVASRTIRNGMLCLMVVILFYAYELFNRIIAV